MSKVIRIDPDNPSAEAVNLAATVLREGGIVVFPTETVYGIGASASSCIGPQEIIDIKMRPKSKPLPWLVEDASALDTYGVDVPEYARRLARAFWPGALTIVVKAAPVVAPEFRDERGTVALRCPDHELVQELIRATGAAIIATSANTSGRPPAASFEELEERIVAAADLTLDGGETEHGVASTVVDCTGPEPVVVREGAIPAEQVLAAASAQEA
ncbi:L-threonylcarbamoyladenylate synthase [Coriobacteriia bacterium Es71-Z0120]|uniref:L-threonylcarbamoyladenylate synthase n=1 Tax=Parvivirga hydrogeniphila TaxID=2939460 RepID=UPI00226094EB|nr:L-threonylcarbamoyladenylate synthase [Parvivirga hydrogeniphila]MCL4078765.1 L-threonylcarbamoyladenylate synthase [Parvivirga hydrogeniphila]